MSQTNRLDGLLNLGDSSRWRRRLSWVALVAGSLVAIAMRVLTELEFIELFGVGKTPGEELQFQRAVKVAWIVWGTVLFVAGAVRGRRWAPALVVGLLVVGFNWRNVQRVEVDLAVLTATYDEWALRADATLDAIEVPDAYVMKYQSGSGVRQAHEPSDWYVSRSMRLSTGESSDGFAMSIGDELGVELLWCSIRNGDRWVVYKTAEDQHLVINESGEDKSTRLSIQFNESDESKYAGDVCDDD